MELAIETNGLRKSFGDHVAVDDACLRIEAGKVHAILGPNGAGKTTLLRMLATQLPIDGGQASIFGTDVAKDPMAVRRMIGVTGQFATVDEDLTALENLEIAGRLHGMSKADSLRRGKELLEQFSLARVRDKALSEFSGGMRRRLDLAAGLMVRPKLIILDEPTTGLDPITRNELWDVIRSLVNEGATALLTTQYLEEADQLASCITIMKDGKLIAEGTPAQLKSRVGESYLDVSFEDVASAIAAKKITDAVTGSSIDIGEIAANQISCEVNGTDEVLILLKALDDAGIAIKEFSIRKPTLDDVFVSLVQDDK